MILPGGLLTIASGQRKRHRTCTTKIKMRHARDGAEEEPCTKRTRYTVDGQHKCNAIIEALPIDVLLVNILLWVPPTPETVAPVMNQVPFNNPKTIFFHPSLLPFLPHPCFVKCVFLWAHVFLVTSRVPNMEPRNQQGSLLDKPLRVSCPARKNGAHTDDLRKI
jgi:hypothetical protein